MASSLSCGIYEVKSNHFIRSSTFPWSRSHSLVHLFHPSYLGKVRGMAQSRFFYYGWFGHWNLCLALWMVHVEVGTDCARTLGISRATANSRSNTFSIWKDVRSFLYGRRKASCETCVWVHGIPTNLGTCPAIFSGRLIAYRRTVSNCPTFHSRQRCTAYSIQQQQHATFP